MPTCDDCKISCCRSFSSHHCIFQVSKFATAGLNTGEVAALVCCEFTLGSHEGSGFEYRWSTNE